MYFLGHLKGKYVCLFVCDRRGKKQKENQTRTER